MVRFFGYFTERKIAIWLFILGGFFIWFHYFFINFLSYRFGGTFFTVERVFLSIPFWYMAYIIRNKWR